MQYIIQSNWNDNALWKNLMQVPDVIFFYTDTQYNILCISFMQVLYVKYFIETLRIVYCVYLSCKYSMLYISYRYFVEYILYIFYAGTLCNIFHRDTQNNISYTYFIQVLWVIFCAYISNWYDIYIYIYIFTIKLCTHAKLNCFK